MTCKSTKIAMSLSTLLLVCNSQASATDTNTIARHQIGAANPSTIYVGYWSNLNTNDSGNKSNPTLAATARAGYNVIPVAFGVIKGTTVSFYDNGWNNKGYGVDIDQAGFWSDVHAAHQAGGIVLLSFGGGSNNKFSWDPDMNNAAGAADNVVTFLANNYLDGMDFDIEAGMSQDPDYLKAFIGELRKKAASMNGSFPNGFYVTGSPQLVNGSQIQWNGGQPSGINPLLSSTACDNQACFDSLNIQNYNNGTSLPLSVSDAYKITLKQLNDNGNNGKTTINIGYPATINDGAGYVLPETISSQLQSVVGGPQFGGIMVWTASTDYTDQNSPWYYISTINSNQPVPPAPGEAYFILQVSNTGNAKYTSASLVVNGRSWIFGGGGDNPIAPSGWQAWGTLASSKNPSTPNVTDSGNLDNIFSNGVQSFTTSIIYINQYNSSSDNINKPQNQFSCNYGASYVFKVGHTYNLMVNPDNGACAITQVN